MVQEALAILGHSRDLVQIVTGYADAGAPSLVASGRTAGQTLLTRGLWDRWARQARRSFAGAWTR